MISIIILLLVTECALVFGLALFLVSEVQSTWSGAPYVPMSSRLVPELLACAGIGEGDVIYDLGCGDGRILTAALERCHAAKGVGYDVAYWPLLKARCRARWRGLARRTVFVRANLLTAPVQDATVIYLYLFPNLVDRAATHIARQARPGTRVLAPSFPIDVAKHPGFRLLKQQKIGTITAYLYEVV